MTQPDSGVRVFLRKKMSAANMTVIRRPLGGAAPRPFRSLFHCTDGEHSALISVLGKQTSARRKRGNRKRLRCSQAERELQERVNERVKLRTIRTKARLAELDSLFA